MAAKLKFMVQNLSPIMIVHAVGRDDFSRLVGWLI